MLQIILLRILISLSLGIPSLCIWLLLRYAEKRGRLSRLRMMQIDDYLKFVACALMVCWVLAEATDKRMLSSGLNVNFSGFLLISIWWRRRIKACGPGATTILSLENHPLPGSH
jgi:hypothetical protein